LSAPAEVHPRTFISYSHDSPEHLDRVLALADQLRYDGIDCRLDQYEDIPVKGWPRWMRQQLDEAEHVVVICTETYLRRFEGKEPPGMGRGASWEGAIITQELYEAHAQTRRFIPVVFSGADLDHIPLVLRATTGVDLDPEHDIQASYERLYRLLTEQHLTPAPPLGPLRRLEPKPRPTASYSLRKTGVPLGPPPTPRVGPPVPACALRFKDPCVTYRRDTHKLTIDVELHRNLDTLSQAEWDQLMREIAGRIRFGRVLVDARGRHGVIRANLVSATSPSRRKRRGSSQP
jgi:hypothetical protein